MLLLSSWIAMASGEQEGARHFPLLVCRFIPSFLPSFLFRPRLFTEGTALRLVYFVLCMYS
jgi:hypothetical protein